MRVMVTGARGQLGGAIVREFASGHEVVALAHEDLDITDAAAVARAAGAGRPDAIINCAAYNDVDAAEDAPAEAFRVNALGVLALARAARASAAALVHFSTDFVFDGSADRPYVETDRPGPLSVYGASKLVGEWLAREAGRWYVLRVESLFGGSPPLGAAPRGSVGRIVAAILAGQDVPVFVDRVVSPSYAPEVAAATRALLERGVPSGLYHCVNDGTCTWEELAREVGQALAREPRLRPLTLQTAPLRARRPRYSAMSNRKLAQAGITMRPWHVALREYLAPLGASGSGKSAAARHESDSN